MEKVAEASSLWIDDRAVARYFILQLLNFYFHFVKKTNQKIASKMLALL